MTDSTKPSELPFLLGVAGGSGSGKTYFARALTKRLGPELCEIVYQDNFYFDQSNRFDFDGGAVNFDHPSSIDFASLATALGELRHGRVAQIPIYDFVTHRRQASTLAIMPKPVIVIDGILVLHSEPVRRLLHDRLFFDTPEDVRYQRRLDRDVRERGRTPEGVRSQFYKQVKPMHDTYVEASKLHARLVVQDVGHFEETLDQICARFGC